VLATPPLDFLAPIIAGLPRYSNEFLTKLFYISFIGFTCG
jgi:hypothetical protein